MRSTSADTRAHSSSMLSPCVGVTRGTQHLVYTTKPGSEGPAHGHCWRTVARPDHRRAEIVSCCRPQPAHCHHLRTGGPATVFLGAVAISFDAWNGSAIAAASQTLQSFGGLHCSLLRSTCIAGTPVSLRMHMFCTDALSEPHKHAHASIHAHVLTRCVHGILSKWGLKHKRPSVHSAFVWETGFDEQSLLNKRLQSPQPVWCAPAARLDDALATVMTAAPASMHFKRN